MSNKPQRKKIEGQEVLTHDEVFNPPKQEQSEPWKGEKVESIAKDDFDPDKTEISKMIEDLKEKPITTEKFNELVSHIEDMRLAFDSIHSLIAKTHNLENAFDSFKKHTQEKLAQFAKELKATSTDVPGNVTGQGTLKNVASDFKAVVQLGRLAKESLTDANKDTGALKMQAIEAQETYLRQTVDPSEIQFLNQSLAALRKL